MSEPLAASLFPAANDVSPDQAAFYESVVVPRYSSLISQGLLAAVPAGSRARVLDVGCGTGTPSLSLVRRLGEGGQVIGVDPSTAMLDIARARALDELGRRVFYKRERAEQLKFGDEVFDLVVSALTFSKLNDYATALREMGRVLRTGGQLLLAEASAGTFAELTDVLRETLVQKDRDDLLPLLDGTASLFPSEETLRTALESAGFSSVRCSTESFKIPFRNAEEVFADGLANAVYLQELAAHAELQLAVPDLSVLAVQALNLYHAYGPVSLTVNATIVSALR